MMAQSQTEKRIAALDAEIAGIEAEIKAMTEQHEIHAALGKDDEADPVHRDIVAARDRIAAAEARRGPLEAVLEAETAEARAKVAKELTFEADAKLGALEAVIAEASEVAAKLAEVTRGLDEHAALHWSIAARKALEAGGTPARRHIAGMSDLAATLANASRLVQHVAADHSARSVHIPVTTKSRAA